MNENQNDNVQNQDLISEDVAQALANAMDDSQAGSVVQPQPQAQDNPGGQGDEQSNEQAVQQSEPTATPTIKKTPDLRAQDSTNDTPQSELVEIKQQALEQLGPMIDHLDQPPEERFDTLLMMLRATDDPKLVKPAYEAALKIEDQNKKAKALLDIVNEVNYLTSKEQNSQQ